MIYQNLKHEFQKKKKHIKCLPFHQFNFLIMLEIFLNTSIFVSECYFIAQL